MIIQKTRIRNLERYLKGVPGDEQFTFASRVTPEIEQKLSRMGFSEEWTDGESLLPPASAGPSCRKNAEGWLIVHRDQPKETAYREFLWSWTEYHGPYEYEESRIVEQPYQRYPRTQVTPPAIEIATSTTDSGRVVVLSRSFSRVEEQDAILGVNVLLELFGEAEVLHADLSSVIPQEVQRLNWEVLPSGEHPWSHLQPAVKDVLDQQGERKRPVFENRWSTIASYKPDFTAVGRAGFSGYLIFGFPDRDLYILESAYYGNATYVLDRNWETLSTLTKAELLHNSLHRERIVHRDGWARCIDEILTE